MRRFIRHDEEIKVNKYIGATIGYWLREKGISVAILEREGIISRKHLWEIREGFQGTKLLTLIKIARRLGIDPRDLIGNLVEIVYDEHYDDETIAGLIETGEFRKRCEDKKIKEDSEDRS